MFLQYGGLGAWLVPLARWLARAPAEGGLGFAPGDIGWIYSTMALACMIAPLFTGFLADRTFASEKLLGALNGLMALLAAAAGFWCAAHAGEQADPTRAVGPLFIILLAYSTLIMCAITSGSAMTLRNLADPTRQFGRVRLVGTLGWVAAIATVGLLFEPMSADMFLVSAICHGLLAAGARWLPHTPPLGRGRPIAEVVGLPAMKLFRDRSFIVFVAVAFTAHAMQSFYSIFGPLCFAQMGRNRPEVVMSSSQLVEITCMALIPLMIRTVGLKVTLLLGLLGWTVRNAIFMSESLVWVTFVAVPLQGLAYTWFSIVGSLYIDREAPPHLRAGAQSLMIFAAAGPGTLLGNMLAGRIVAAHTVAGATDWEHVWLVPTIGCAAAAMAFLLLFREPKRDDSSRH